MRARIAVPTPGQPTAQTVSALEDIARANGLPPVHYEVAHISAADSKARIHRWFMEETSDDYLFLIDHDVVPPPNLIGMMGHGLPLVGAPYLTFRPEEANLPFPGVYDYVPEVDAFRPVAHVWSRMGLVKCDAVIGGALCLHRTVLHRIKPFFENRYDEWGRADRTEDFVWALKCREAGIPIHADFDRASEHITRVGVRLLMDRIAQGVAEADPVRRILQEPAA